MRMIIEIPDRVYRKAKSKASESGQTLSEFVTEALVHKLSASIRSDEPAWMQGFGKLRHLRRETRRIQAIIDEAFAQA